MVWNCIGIAQYLGVIPAKAGIQKFQKTTGSPIEPFGDDELDMKCRFVIDIASLRDRYNMKRMNNTGSPRVGGGQYSIQGDKP